MFSNFTLCLVSALIVFGCAWETEAKTTVPDGMYVLIPPNIAVPEAVLTSKQVTGVVLRANWQELGYPVNTMKFEHLVAQAKLAKKAGKAVSLVINNGGVNTPPGLQAKTQTVSFINKNRFHQSEGKRITIPLFWDETLINEKKALLSAVAAKFDDSELIDIISLQCANATTDDWNIPDNIDWGHHAFSEDKLFFACKTLIDHAAGVFRHASLKMAFGPLPPSLMENRYALAERVYRYASQTYPERFFMQRHNLSTRTPDPLSAQQLYGWRMVFNARPYAAAQFLWPAKDTRSCRANGNLRPCDSETILRDIAVLARHYDFHYLEVYLSDFLAFGNTSAFTTLADAIGSADTAVQTAMATPVPVMTQATAPQEETWGAWNNPPAKRESATVTHFHFASNYLNQDVGYSLFLPEHVNDSPLPVIYWLHGKGGNEIRGIHLAQFLQSAISQNIIRPTAMVFVNGGRHSFYSDAKSADMPVETMLINELIPTVEKRHNIGLSPDRRLLEGFSMGGFGALKLAAKYTDLFAAVNIYGAALLSEAHPPGKQDDNSFRRVFDADMSYFIANTPAHWLRENEEHIRASGFPIRIRVGTQDGTRRYNQAAIQLLDNLDISYDYAEFEGVRHAPAMYYQADALDNFRFFESVLRRSGAEFKTPQSVITPETSNGTVTVTTVP
ncbi:alpha/beta hydrolase [Alteromonas sp. H39]|uniref:alpha/beta hydrolase n=1 Tax=Alteromonas sp. H39 TaxID=3389876 RepID=UPI0039E02D1B